MKLTKILIEEFVLLFASILVFRSVRTPSGPVSWVWVLDCLSSCWICINSIGFVYSKL